jgi:soluble lytic murein transglycosylase-like protein
MAQVLEEFLVSIGFDPKSDPAIRKFEDSIKKTRLSVVALSAAVTGVAVAVEVGVKKMSDKFESLYYASQRSGAAVRNIQSLGYAMSKMGGQAEDGLSALDGLASFMRSTPAAEKFLGSLGVGTREANGELRDTDDILKDLVPRLKQMPFYLAKAYGGVLGIGENQLITLFRDTGKYREEYLSFLNRAGVDSEKASKASVNYRNELRTLGAMFGVLWDKVMIRAMDPKTGFLVKFRNWFDAYFERIAAGLDTVMDKIGEAADAVADWILSGFEAAQQGKFFEWMMGEWKKFAKWLGELWKDISPYVQRAWASVFGWLSRQWKEHGGAITGTLELVLNWLREAFFGVVDDVADYLGDRITRALEKTKESFLNWATKPLWGAKRDAMDAEEARQDAEERRLRKEAQQRRIDAAREAIAGGFGRMLNAIIPAASANSEAPAAGMGRLSGNLASMFGQAEKKYGLQSGLLRAIGWVESHFNPNAVSPKGARGLMQFMPGTAKRFGIDPMDPAQAIEGAGRYMRALLDMFGGNLQKAIAGYNAGEGNVQKYGGIPPFAETQKYVQAVLGNMQSPALVPPMTLNYPYGASTGGGVTVHQKTDIHVAASDPAAAGSAVLRGQDRVNASLARNFQTRVR